MFIPLGLALKLRELPIITYLIIFICAGYYFIQKPLEKANESIIKANLNEEYFKAKSNLQYEFCINKYENDKVCSHANGFYQSSLGKKKVDENKSTDEKEKEKRNLIKDIGYALTMTAPVVEFNSILLNNPSELKNLKSYHKFMSLNDLYRYEIKNIHKEHGLLSKYHFSFLALVKAIFTHVNLMHLIGNMFMLFIFGRYVESRMGHLSYFLSYLIPGMTAISLYTLYDTGLGQAYVVGASANVSVIMGLFYTLFFHSRMKFWIFYFAVKIVSFKVKTYFFLFYIVLELLLSFSEITGIAHGAHALGLIFGALIGVIWLQLKPLPKNFIYDEEYEKWNRIKDSTDLSLFITEANDLLKYNPDNYEIRSALIEKLFQAQELGSSTYKVENNLILDQHLETFIKTLKYHKMYQEFFDFLNIAPYSRRYTMIFHEIDQKSLLISIDKAIDYNKLYASVRLINIFFEKYPTSKKIHGLKKTLESILENIDKSEKFKNMIQSLSLESKSENLKALFNNIYILYWRQHE